MNSIKKKKDMTLKDEFSRSVGAQYATREEWRNSSRKNEEAEPKQKQQSFSKLLRAHKGKEGPGKTTAHKDCWRSYIRSLHLSL